MYLKLILNEPKLPIAAIYLRIAPFLKFKEIHTFQDKTPKGWEKNQRSATFLGGISNQQTDPGTGTNDPSGKLNGG